MDTVREEEVEEEEEDEDEDEADDPENHSSGEWGRTVVFPTVSARKSKRKKMQLGVLNVVCPGSLSGRCSFSPLDG